MEKKIVIQISKNDDAYEDVIAVISQSADLPGEINIAVGDFALYIKTKELVQAIGETRPEEKPTEAE